MENRKAIATVKAYRIVIIMVMVLGFGMWAFIPNHKPVNLTDLTKKEILEAANADSLVGHGFFRLPEGRYHVINEFYSDTVKINSVKHYEEVTYKYSNISFRDAKGENVVIVLKTDSDLIDPRKHEGEVVGKMNLMSDQMKGRQIQSYDDKNRLDGVMFYQTISLETRIKELGAKIAFVCAILVAGLSLVLRRAEGSARESEWIE